MQRIGITSTALLSLLLALADPVYAQHEQQGEKQDHPAPQQDKHEQARPEQQHARQQQQTEQKFRELGFVDYGGDGLQVHNSLLNIVLHD